MVETPNKTRWLRTRHRLVALPKQRIPMPSTTTGVQLPNQSLRNPTRPCAPHSRNLCSRKQMTRSRTISDLLPLQNKSECHTSLRSARSPVLAWTNHKSSSKRRKKNAFRLNCKNLRSSTNRDRFWNSKSERRLSASEKRKKLSKRKFDNFKCYVSSRKLKMRRRRLLLRRRSVNRLQLRTLASSHHKALRCLPSTTPRQQWERAKDTVI